MRIRAGTPFPVDSAPGESRVAVVLRYRTYHHDPDTIALLTFRSATTDFLCASRGSAPEHSQADQYTNAYHPTHRHLDLRSFGLRSMRRKYGAGDSSRFSFLCERAVPPVSGLWGDCKRSRAARRDDHHVHALRCTRHRGPRRARQVTASPRGIGEPCSTASPPGSIRSCATSSRAIATTGRRTRPSTPPTSCSRVAPPCAPSTGGCCAMPRSVCARRGRPRLPRPQAPRRLRGGGSDRVEASSDNAPFCKPSRKKALHRTYLRRVHRHLGRRRFLP